MCQGLIVGGMWGGRGGGPIIVVYYHNGDVTQVFLAAIRA